MTQPMIRAFSVHRELEFIDQHFDEADRERVKAQIPSELQEEIGRLSKVDWCPIDHSSTVLRAIASAKNEPKGAYQDIIECGKFLSVEATNTFYKLLLKVVTPAIMLNKLDTFWAKDFKNAGRWEVQIEESGNVARMKLSGVADMDHIAPLSEGFLIYLIEAMGHDVTCEVDGWSFEAPGPETISYTIRWT